MAFSALIPRRVLRWRRLAAFAPMAFFLGCSTSGQTGSPRDGRDAPDYSSPSRFSPDDGGGPTGGEGDGPGQGFYEIINRTWDLLSGVSGDTLAVFATPEQYTGPRSYPRQRGLLLFDVSGDGEPTLMGELELPGYPERILVQEDRVTVLVTQPNETTFDEVPSEPVPVQVLRLIQVDISDPSDPTVLSTTDIPGSYSRSFIRGTTLTVATSQSSSSEPECNPESSGLLIAEIERAPEFDLWVGQYDLSSDEAELTDEAWLEGPHQLLDAAGEHLLAAKYVSGETGIPESELVVLSAAGGSLEVGAPLAFPSLPSAARLHEDDAGNPVAGVATTLSAGQNSYTAFAIDGELALAEIGSAPLPSRMTELVKLDATRLLAEPESFEEASTSSLIEVSGSGVTATSVPAMQASALEGELATHFLAVTRTASGSVELSLRAVAAPSVALTAATSNWPHTGGQFRVEPSTHTVLYPSNVYDSQTGEVQHQIGVAQLSSDVASEALSAANVATAVLDVNDAVSTVDASSLPIATSDAAYVAGADGLSAVPLNGEAPTLVPVYPERDGIVLSEVVLSEVESGDVTIRLMQGDDSVWIDFLSEDGSARQALEHFGEELTLIGDQLLALGLRRESGCDEFSEQPNPDFEHVCPTPNVAGITVFDISELELEGEDSTPPEVQWSQVLETGFDGPELPADASFENTWQGYLKLSGDELLLPARQVIFCESEAACDALDIQGEAGQASPGCNPETQDCDELPEVINFFSGAKVEQVLYTLSLGGMVPVLSQVLGGLERGNLHSEGPLSLEGQILQAGNVLGFPDEEYLEMGDEAEPYIRHWLTKVDLGDADTAPQAVRINTPGLPLKLVDDGNQLISVEPSADGEFNALAHLSTLEGNGAYIDATLELGPGFDDSTVVGEQVFLQFGPAERCEASPTTRVFSVSASGGELEASSAIELPGENWGFTWYERPWPDDTVMLRGGPSNASGRLTLDVSDAGEAPSVVEYRANL